ncbi:MAG: SURF1 family cytochrome oxidase biogenesis protein [Pontimonas sp.]
MWRVALRPRWLAALAFALAMAGIFAALSQWQLDRSIEQASVVERDTETAVALSSVATPQSTISTDASGRKVTAQCSFVPGDDVVITQRYSETREGSWLVRHCQTPEGYSLAVAAGWLDGLERTAETSEKSAELIGRYVPTESPQESDFLAGENQVVSVAELINLWVKPGPVYGGYLVLDQAPQGLASIVTTPPETDRELNWLNIFYAAEWVIFALFALYLWYRLVKDVWERELEEALTNSG